MQDTKPQAFRELYSLFSEAAQSAQDAADGALVVLPQVHLQHAGQRTLLHPHLNSGEGQSGYVVTHFNNPPCLDCAFCFLCVCFLFKSLSAPISLTFSLAFSSKSLKSFLSAFRENANGKILNNLN